MKKLPEKTKQNARQLRNNMTDAEQKLWQRLRMQQMHGFKFRRQHPCEGFILDFACIELKLAVEVDGGQHNENREKDAKRTAILESHGWKVLRFWNHEVLQEVNVVLSVIEGYCRPSF
jgi:very-short-patch-repair endonuclease